MYCKANELFYFKDLNDNVMISSVMFEDCCRMYLHDNTAGNFVLIIQKDIGLAEIDYSIHDHHGRYNETYRDAVDCAQRVQVFVNAINNMGLGAER